MAELGSDFARAVASDAERGHADDFGRRDLAWHDDQLGPPPASHKVTGYWAVTEKFAE